MRRRSVGGEGGGALEKAHGGTGGGRRTRFFEHRTSNSDFFLFQVYLIFILSSSKFHFLLYKLKQAIELLYI